MISNSVWPKISIITPSFNQGRFIEKTILSVLDQEYPNLEYIIIDGGSTDNTKEVIQKYEGRITFWISEKDEGQSDALKKGFSKATGEILAWINSDDYYEKNALHTVASNYITNKFDILCGSSDMIREDGSLVQHLYTPEINVRSLLRYWKPHFCPPQPSIFFRRSVLYALGGINTKLHFAMDYELWLRASRFYQFSVIPDKLSNYLIHESSKTGPAAGFQEFLPEWKKVINRELKEIPFGIKFRYHLEKFAHSFSTVLKS